MYVGESLSLVLTDPYLQRTWEFRLKQSFIVIFSTFIIIIIIHIPFHCRASMYSTALELTTTKAPSWCFSKMWYPAFCHLALLTIPHPSSISCNRLEAWAVEILLYSCIIYCRLCFVVILILPYLILSCYLIPWYSYSYWYWMDDIDDQ